MKVEVKTTLFSICKELLQFHCEMLSWKPFSVESALASNSNSHPGTKKRVTNHEGKGQFAGYYPQLFHVTMTQLRHLVAVKNNDTVPSWPRDDITGVLLYFLF